MPLRDGSTNLVKLPRNRGWNDYAQERYHRERRAVGVRCRSCQILLTTGAVGAKYLSNILNDVLSDSHPDECSTRCSHKESMFVERIYLRELHTGPKYGRI
jgi:hypothetical protein